MKTQAVQKAVGAGLRGRKKNHIRETLIRVSMELYEGPLNDVVKVWVDGALLHTGTSWEDYFRWCEYSAYGNRHESRTVDSILFRTSGTAQPATLGKGFLIDNMTLFSGRLTLDIDLRPGSVDNQVNTNAKQLVPVAILATDTFDPCVEADIASLEARSARPTQTKYDCSDIDACRRWRSATPMRC